VRGLLFGGVALVALSALAVYLTRPKPPDVAGPGSLVVEPRQAEPESAPPAARADNTLPPPERFTPPPSPAGAEAPAPEVTAETPAPPAAPPSPPKPSSAEIQAALRATRVVMFGTSWCPHCTRARDFLSANGLSFEERDIDRDERAKAELKRLTGKSGVPAFLVDGNLVGPGFDKRRLMHALVASVEKRLGVRGLRVVTEQAQ
jgi:glutaredoxin